MIGLDSEEADKLWEMDTIFLTTVGVEGDGFGTSPADKSMTKDSYISIDGTQEQIHPCSHSVKVQTHSKISQHTKMCSKVQRKNVIYGIQL